MTKEDRFIKIVKENSKFMGKITQALDVINDNNILHRQSLDLNTKATETMSKSVDKVIKFFFFIIILLIGTLIIIAGAEKVFQYIHL